MTWGWWRDEAALDAELRALVAAGEPDLPGWYAFTVRLMVREWRWRRRQLALDSFVAVIATGGAVACAVWAGAGEDWHRIYFLVLMLVNAWTLANSIVRGRDHWRQSTRIIHDLRLKAAQLTVLMLRRKTTT